MEATLDIEAVGKYAEGFAEKICNDFYQGREYATGKDLTAICTVRQVNLFVVQEIFAEWQEEQSEFISPYFDYSSSDVRKAMGHLFTALSQNVQVEEGNLKPLLAKAIFEAIIIALEPEWYFRDYFGGGDDEGLEHKTLDEVRNAFKYIEQHAKLKSVILEELTQMESETIHEQELVEMILAYAKDTALLDGAELITSGLGSIVAFDIASFYLKDQTTELVDEYQEDSAEDDFDLSDSDEEVIDEEATSIDSPNQDDDARVSTEIPRSEDQMREEADVAFDQDFEIESEEEAFDIPAVEPELAEEEETLRPNIERASIGAVIDNTEPTADEALFDLEDESEKGESHQITSDPEPSERDGNTPDLSAIDEPAAPELVSEEKTGFISKIPSDKCEEFIAELFGDDRLAFEEAGITIGASADYHEGIAAIREKYFDKYNWDLTGDATIEFLNYFDEYFS